MLRSYLESPEEHARLAKDPDLAGGAFCGISPSLAIQVRELLEKAEHEQKANVELAKDAINFQNLLQNEVNGQCLQPYYRKIPERLRGYVELVYDYYNHPTVRFLENLLYESEYYNKGIQSIRAFQLLNDHDRSFAFSTPRLSEPGDIEWKLSFDDPALDEFFKLDVSPQPLSGIMELLGLNSRHESRLLKCLTEDPVRLPARWKERGVRMRYFGHACVLLEWGGVSILMDPYISSVPVNGGLDRFSFQDLPEKIDYALVTHEHSDHFSLETLLRLRGRIECLVVPKALGFLYGDISLKLMARKLNFKRVMELDSLETIPLIDGEIIGIPFLGEHGDLAQGKTAYVVRAGKEQILFAADSDCLDRKLYENIRKIIGSVGTVFLGTECVGAPLTWRNGPLFPMKPSRNLDQTRRQNGCDADRALNLLEALGAKRVYNYGMGREPWLNHLLGANQPNDSPQLRESELLIQRSHARGFIEAESPVGKCEIFLEFTGAATRQSSTRELPGSEYLQTRLAYWRRQFSGIDFKEKSLFEKGQTQNDSPRTRSEFMITLPTLTRDALTSLCEANRYPVGTILFSAFQIALHKRTGKDDLFVVAALDRPSPSQTLLNGSSNKNVIFSRTDLSGNPTFLALARRTEDVIERALDFWLPPETLLESFNLSRQAALESIFQIRFIDGSEATQSDITEMRMEYDANFKVAADLECLVDHCFDRISITLQYNPSVVESETAKLIAEQYAIVLDAAAAHPDQTIEQLPSLSQVPGQRIAFNKTGDSQSGNEDQFFF